MEGQGAYWGVANRVNIELPNEDFFLASQLSLNGTHAAGGLCCNTSLMNEDFYCMISVASHTSMTPIFQSTTR